MSALQRAWPSLTSLLLTPGVRTAVAGGVVALLVLQGVRLLWLVLTPIGPLGTAQTGAVATLDVSALRRDVFYRSASDANSDGIVLHGVRVGGSQAAAYLSGNDGRQGAYRAGDTVTPGVVVQAIAADHVLLRAGGSVRRIALRESAAAALPPAGTGATASAAVAAAVQSNVATAADPTAATAVDPQQLLASAGLRASAEGDGFTLMPRGDGALLRQAGLAPGDVLTQINGRPLDAEHLRELQDELRNGQSATLTYRRDGQTRTMTLKRPQ
ncbi:PDZ domain-containing protein [Xanthomonas citri pv. fuscans CFBP 6996]|uniref:type II secretion system protein N n=1 Tax=Xanthomonas citri TaxID=346 RepID=UPI000C1A5CB8|nr:type II secretion system protein N [Xanthomonas citri]ATS50455.1 PDZ domain-containing protein [Xanthomonas citri pv. phaseoli var. fuscans]ATS56190.1 PDZ domain-containing protein [Xanthomonas citri pv. phaseoli var. fuscans]ATS59796.1 PDZ domain-containing protein [Xanthomonas citri pv. phaseoli var. fuscans]PTY31125.1 PDZ domain-containing protein [Xanthomonas citri pv. fuscans CFBP 6996]QWN15061.1 PDZ domain-containing protein [Xanthomonas citri]